MEEVPRRTSLVPLVFPCFELCLIGVETERLLDYQGRAGIISIVRWNLCPVIFDVEKRRVIKTPLNVPEKMYALFSCLEVFHCHFCTVLHLQLQMRFQTQFSGTDMTGPLGQTMEMNGGITASYLARTPCVPLFMLALTPYLHMNDFIARGHCCDMAQGKRERLAD